MKQMKKLIFENGAVPTAVKVWIFDNITPVSGNNKIIMKNSNRILEVQMDITESYNNGYTSIVAR